MVGILWSVAAWYGVAAVVAVGGLAGERRARGEAVLPALPGLPAVARRFRAGGVPPVGRTPLAAD